MVPIGKNSAWEQTSIDEASISDELEFFYTTSSEVTELMGNVPYDDDRTPSQNLVKFLVNGGQLPSSKSIVLCFPEISFKDEKNDILDFPPNVTIAARLTSAGFVTLYGGSVIADADWAVVGALSEHAQASNNNDYPESIAQPYNPSFTAEMNRDACIAAYKAKLMNHKTSTTI